ncbi:MAG TPA: DUF2520 domain-containing protein [Acidimicrobiales bacterium]|nr:DUF2520 domain-containing protein [Acidimicrobiales bacterium]
MKVRIVGRGRAGRSFELALRDAGVDVELLPGRAGSPRLAGAAEGCDALLLAVPDRHLGAVAAAVEPAPGCVLVHCSGSLGLDVLPAAFGRRASLHPLATLPDPVIGSLRLRGGTFFAVSGDPVATELALLLGGQPIVVADGERARYHAAACIASNHLVALLGQVQRVAAEAGLPLEAFLPLARGALEDVGLLGPARALTGPASRGDEATIDAHRAVLGTAELPGYDAGVALARLLAGGAGGEAETAGAVPAPAVPTRSSSWS